MTYSFKHNNQVYKLSFENEGDNLVVEIDNNRKPVEYKKLDDYLYSVIINGKSHKLAVLKKGKHIQVFFQGNLFNFETVSEREQASGGHSASGSNQISSPMPGRIVKVLKHVDDKVEEGRPQRHDGQEDHGRPVHREKLVEYLRRDEVLSWPG